MPLQAKLLRVIQDGVVRRVGSEQPDAVVDVRFISATNREPQEAVDSRHAARRPVLPAARRADQAAAAAQAAGGHPAARQPFPDRTTGSATARWATACPELSEASIAFLRSRAVARQRSRAAERDRARRRARGARPADPAERHPALRRRRRSGRPTARRARGIMDEAYHAAKDRVVAQFEKEYLTRLVSRAGGNMSKAARLASIDRTTLYRLMDKHAFHRDESRGRLSDTEPPCPAPPAASAAGRRRRRRPARVWIRTAIRRRDRAAAVGGLREAVLWAQSEWERAAEHAPAWTRSPPTCAAARGHPAAGHRSEPATSARSPGIRCRAAWWACVRSAFLERAQALPALETGQLLRLLLGARAGEPAARGRLVPALRRPPVRPRRARARGRGGARPPLAPHLDPLPRRDPAARPQRPGQPAPGAAARPDLQRRVRAQLGGERRDRAGARRRPAGRPAIRSRSRSPTSWSRCATSCSPSPRRRASSSALDAPGRGLSASGTRSRSAGCCSTSPPTPSSSPTRVRRGRRAARRWAERSSSRCATPDAGFRPRRMATLFEPFRRRQKPGEYAFSGSGLGLSICRKLVEAMGSTLGSRPRPATVPASTSCSDAAPRRRARPVRLSAGPTERVAVPAAEFSGSPLQERSRWRARRPGRLRAAPSIDRSFLVAPSTRDDPWRDPGSSRTASLPCRVPGSGQARREGSARDRRDGRDRARP